ncbi:MAG: hypothetical protein WD628_04465 [Thermomicrobiales bacterium]
MGDRRSYGSGRNSATNRRGNATRPADQSQRNMFIGVGFFVVALLVIGLILFSSRGDDDNNPGVGFSDATSTATTVASVPQPSATVAAAATQTETGPTTNNPTSTFVSTATAGANPTETTEIDTVEPTPTDESADAEPEPTDSPPTEVPEPTEEPLVGEFGNLPPAQIVSGGLSRPLDLDYELGISLDDTPSTAPVYLMEWPAWTEDDVATIAASLDLEGEIEGGPGNYQVFGATSELYFSGPTIQYVFTGDIPDVALGNDAVVIRTARSWIYANGFINDDLDGGSVIGRDDDAGRAVVLFKPAEPSPLLAFVPSATVTVGQGEIVIEANIRWPTNYVTSDYGLRSGDELWNTVLAGEGSIEADLSGVGGNGALSGTLTIHSVAIAYSYAGSSGSNEYLVPLIVFSGEAVLNESDTVVPVSIYVPAVYGQSTPQG